MVFKFIPILSLFLVGILLEVQISASFSQNVVGHPENGLEQITEFPLDFQETETTTEGYSFNATLDTLIVNNTGAIWKYSSLSLKKWFEYYNDIVNLKDFAKNETTCAHVISDTANKLDEKDGIWVSCYDSTLNPECLSARPCYPEISYNFGSFYSAMRTVKIYLSLRGLAVVRLTVGTSVPENPNCFDYSRREDPFSPCKHIYVNSTSEWVVVRSGFDGYFSSFTVSLITRFRSDVALVDKIEATDYLLCGYAENNCTTTSPGPTRSTPTTTTLFPPATNLTTTEPTSTRRNRVTTTLAPGNSTPSSNKALDIKSPIFLLLSTLQIMYSVLK